MPIMPDPIPYQCFISYTRDDNNDFDDVVDRLKRELAGRFEAATGSRLEIFLDRDSIGWGERWRDKIAEAVAGSVLFIPIVTMRYFNSAPCREEFSAFYSAAARKGVPDLILPIILAGKNQITPEHSDELVRAIEELNWQPIFEEFDAGYQSSEWKRRIGTLAKGLQDALAKASVRLGEQSAKDPAAKLGDTARIDQIDQQVIEAHLEEFTAGLSELQPLLEQVANAVQNRLEGRDIGQMASGQRNIFIEALAEDLRQPAAEFGTKASALEASSRQLDAELRAMIAEMHEIAPEETAQQLEALHKIAQVNSQGSQETLEQLSLLERGMRMAALTSVKLRKSLQPMTAGVRSLDTMIKILRSWETINPSGSE